MSDNMGEMAILIEEKDKAVKHAVKLGNTLTKNKSEKKKLARTIDVIRQLITVGTAVIIVLLIILAFVHHPSLESTYKYYVLGGMSIICVGFSVSLWLAKGNPVMLLSLVALGGAVFMFTLGYAVSEMKRSI